MPSNYEEKSRKRFQFLKALYDITDGDENLVVNLWELGESVGLDQQDTGKIFDYLAGEDLVSAPALGPVVSITHAGVVEIEQAERVPQQPTQHFPANVINIHGNITGAALQVGNTNSTQMANISISPQVIAELSDWLNRLKGNLPSLGLTEAARHSIARNITSIENETKEPQPSRDILRPLLHRIQGLLQEVGTHMVADELLRQLPALMQHLHL